MPTPASHEPRDVTASEIGTYAYCARAWHLERVVCVGPSRDAVVRRADGVVRHERHGRRVGFVLRAGPRLLRLGVVLLLVAALLAVLALATRIAR